MFLPAMYISVTYNAFDFTNATPNDIIFIALTFSTLLFYGVLYAFINQKIEKELITEEKGMS